MANDTNFWGLRPVKHISGAPWNGVTEKCYVGSDYATAMYIGDPVQISTDSSASHATAMYTSVILAGVATTSVIYGVITSFDDSEDYSTVYRAGATERYINVCVDPTVIYYIRGNGAAAPTAATPFLNAIMVAGTSSTVTGLSGKGLDEGTGSSPATTIGHQLTILRLANLPDNEMAAYAIYEVLINTHQLRAAAVGTVTGITKS